MYDPRTRLDQDLKAAVSRLRQLGAAAAVEERPATIGDTCPFADAVDGIQAGESREIGFATRELVLERVNRLSAALDRMNAGEYGTCVECDAPISLARLAAMPEAQTCVRCQDGLERLGQPRPMIYGNGVRQQRNRHDERAAARHWPQGGAELAPESSNVVITASTRARLTGPAWQPRNGGR
jgi:RNA polymerase-binding transcription factor